MELLCSGKQMQEIDRYSIQEMKIPSLVLMERAALAVRDAVLRRWKPGGRIVAVCGSGNNGADGLAAVRLLSQAGCPAEAILAGSEEHETRECRLQREILVKLEIPVHRAAGDAYDKIRGAQILIDAVFGVGLSRDVKGTYARMIEAVNQADGQVVSVDIPSGVSADTGKVLGCAVNAAETVTFGFRKLGQILYPGAGCCGKLTVAEIGFAPVPGTLSEELAYTFVTEDLDGLPQREADSNKGSFGKTAVFAGCKNMAGAAALCGLSAYRAGAGLVRLVTEEENRMILQQLVPEAVMTTLERNRKERIAEALEWATVIVLGPGLGRSEEAGEEVRQVLEYGMKHPEKPVAADADALNLLSENPQWRIKGSGNLILTPHPGELSRLLGRSVEKLKEDFPGAVRDCAEKYGAVVVGKDSRTVVSEAEGPVFVNTSGNSAMAKAGSGDVLCGVIAGLLARGVPARSAAEYGAYVHGLAGDLWVREHGCQGMTAMDLSECLSRLWF